MPGTPPTSPRFGAPRHDNGTADFAAQVNGVTDVFDALAARIESGLAAAPPAAGIVNRFYRETDTGILRVDTGSALAHITPGPHASRHQDGGADPLTVREAMMATGNVGLAKGAFCVYRNAAVSYSAGARVAFDTELFDVSDWYDSTTNFRYTPQVAGYYRFSGLISAGVALTADNYWYASLYKNAVEQHRFPLNYQRGTAGFAASGGTAPPVLANGTTDYFDLRLGTNQGTATALGTGVHLTYFGGELIGRS